MANMARAHREHCAEARQNAIDMINAISTFKLAHPTNKTGQEIKLYSPFSGKNAASSKQGNSRALILSH